MRQVVLDTETTGLDPDQGHRIIEIGCVELINRRLTNRHFHVYINPEREIDPGAIEVHGITNEFLADKPNFAGVVDEFIALVRGAELIIHNAAFDLGFLNAELVRLGRELRMGDLMAGGEALDTLAMARSKRPGKRNSLDALCRDYKIDASERSLHGALLDAELLTLVYLSMTREQSSLLGGDFSDDRSQGREQWHPIERTQVGPVIPASEDEIANHASFLDVMREQGTPLWDRLES